MSSIKEVNPQKQFLRARAVCETYSISKTTLYKWLRQGKFPQPIRLSPRLVGWDKSVLDDFFFNHQA